MNWIDKKVMIKSNSFSVRHLWNRSGKITEIIHFPKTTFMKEYSLIVLEFDEPIPEIDEFGHKSHLSGWRKLKIDSLEAESILQEI
jgi:hypothetical protein